MKIQHKEFKAGDEFCIPTEDIIDVFQMAPGNIPTLSVWYLDKGGKK